MIFITLLLLFLLTIITVIFIFIKKYMETKQQQTPPLPTQQIPEKPGITERFGTTLKVIVVAFLTLLLLIPLEMVKSLIRERQGTKQEAVADITSKWGGEQTITGPCLVVPYLETTVEDKKQVEVRRNLLLLPESFDVQGNVSVETRKRGIYDASVYGSDIILSGEFDMAALSKSGVKPEQIQWNNLQLILSLSDLKGINENVELELNGEKVIFEPGLQVDNLAVGYGATDGVMGDKGMVYGGTNANAPEIFSVGLSAKLDSGKTVLAMQGKQSFRISLKMNGSQGFYVIPVGKTTTVHIQSDWATPSFGGEFLPETRDVTNQGFTADWKVLDLNRSYGQTLRTDNNNSINQMASSRFGVRFIQAVDQYQQNMRSVKYAILIVLLTFVAVFFIELIKKKQVNPFQYLLVGLALVLFYTLLLSMSEVWGFNLAYLVAALMTTVLIGLHMASILKNRMQGVLIAGLLTFFYLFIFILIQMESYALLVGSLVLFAILAVIMYVSKRVKI